MKYDVLDKGWVELLTTNIPDGTSGDQMIVNAARTSYLGESKGEEQDKRLLMYLMKHRHTSPFEMVQFTFRVHAPLVVWWQWTRHRTWSFNLQSGRYTAFEEDEFYVPDKWRRQDKTNKQASSESFIDPSLKTELLNHYKQSYALYTEALRRGVAREMARLFLPGFSVYYTGVVSVDAHNLMRFFQLRLPANAQYEIRVYAEAMYEIFKTQLAWTAEGFETYYLSPF